MIGFAPFSVTTGGSPSATITLRVAFPRLPDESLALYVSVYVPGVFRSSVPEPLTGGVLASPSAETIAPPSREGGGGEGDRDRFGPLRVARCGDSCASGN